MQQIRAEFFVASTTLDGHAGGLFVRGVHSSVCARMYTHTCVFMCERGGAGFVCVREREGAVFVYVSESGGAVFVFG